ncbi:right-handed parallel beta-helix repeat-containing protein [Candidatus Acetothermia bacterium]|nr:right-handed parallel beta-helix repeat-containing protein [Candidatus Acetothermia bacterium]
MIFITGSDEIQVTLEAITVTGAKQSDGIQIQGKARVTLMHSQVSHNDGDGLLVEGLASTKLIDSQASNNGGHGLDVLEEAVVALIGSQFENNKKCGISGGSSGSLIVGWSNRFSNNRQDACDTDRQRLSRTLPPHPHSRRQITVPEDVPSIQEAIDLVADGGTINVSPGLYNETLEISNISFVLRGTDTNRVRLASEGRSSAILIFSETSTYVQLERLTIGPSSARGLLVRGSTKMALIDVRVSGNRDDGLFLKDSVQVEIKDSIIQDNKGLLSTGIFARDSASASLQNVQIFGNEDDGILVRDSATVRMGNVQLFQNGAEGFFVRDTARVEIEGSTIRDNEACGIWIYSKEAQVSGAPNRMYRNGVDLCGFASAVLRKPLVPQTTRTQLSVPENYKSLQEAVDAIAPGGTITVSAGLYETGLTLWKPLVLQGVDKIKTTLKALPKSPLVSSIIPDARGVIIRQLTLAGSRWYGALVHGYARFEAVQFSHNAFGGLVVGEGARVSLNQSVISQNKSGGLTIGGSLVVISAQVNLSDSQISDNELHGLLALGSAQVDLIASQVSGNGGNGLSVRESAQVSLTHTQVAQNGANGLALEDLARAHLTDSQVSRNGRSLLGAFSDSVGIALKDSARLILDRSQVAQNKKTGLDWN